MLQRILLPYNSFNNPIGARQRLSAEGNNRD
jgi:hypothetical protein